MKEKVYLDSTIPSDFRPAEIVGSLAHFRGTVFTRGPSLPRRVDARSDPPYAGTFFICWGDETLNMIVNSKGVLVTGFPLIKGMTGE